MKRAYKFNESKHINLTDWRQQNSHDKYRESALTMNFESKKFKRHKELLW